MTQREQEARKALRAFAQKYEMVAVMGAEGRNQVPPMSQDEREAIEKMASK